MHTYSDNVMSLSARSRRSAAAVIAVLRRDFAIDSVADFGCAWGTWLACWRQSGVDEVLGVDGDYVGTERLEIPADAFQVRDLATPIDLGRRFSLVQSLEVAEHLPSAAAATFVESLTRHADLVLFSASPPGQGGENHLNEQPYEYWRDLFAARGFAMLDCIRPAILEDRSVRYWYRYNTFLFVREDVVPRLPERLRPTRIARGAPVPDLSSRLFRLRKAVVRRLPASVQSALCRAMQSIRAFIEAVPLRRRADGEGRPVSG
jgi:hypothetical protein